MKINIKTGVRLHNRFDFVITDVETGKVDRAYADLGPMAENIVLSRMYSRLLGYSTFFNNIVFGSGTGVLSEDRTTLFAKIGSKPAVTEQLIRSYPTSMLTKSIRLGTEDYNGTFLREVAISDDTTQINTHALITDAEGHPLELEKTALKIIDIYATLFAEVYDVDSGLFFYADGLRDYLTGGSAPNNNLRLYYLSDDTSKTLTGTKTTNAINKSISVAVRFNIDDFNKDVKYIDWVGLGIRCKIPRDGVFTSKVKTGVQLGVADGVKSKFSIPNKGITGITIKVDGTVNTNWTIDLMDDINFTVIPTSGLVTADYTCTMIPKDIFHVLDISMDVAFAGGVPTPIVPDIDYSGLPGPKILSGGTAKLGYFGETLAADLINGADLATAIGLTAGTLINSDAGWLKYGYEGNIIYVSKKNIRHSASWDHINAAGSAFGERVIELDGKLFAVRLLSTQEWDKLIYPVHVNYGQFAQFTDAELNISGIYTWTSSPTGAYRILRGGISVTYSIIYSPSVVGSNYGFRPVLVFLKTL